MTPQLWLLSERDYETGRRLYEALGPNPQLKRTLSSGPSRYNVEALAYELGKLAKAGVAVDVVPNLTLDTLQQLRQALPDAAFRAEVLSEAPPAAHPALQQLKAERPDLYDERRFLHAQLLYMGSDAARLQAALRIQAISRKLNENWQLDAYVRAHGALPAPPPAAAPLDVQAGTLATLLSARANLRSQISKLKKKPARAADLAQAQAEEQLLTSRIDQLKGEEQQRG